MPILEKNSVPEVPAPRDAITTGSLIPNEQEWGQTPLEWYKGYSVKELFAKRVHWTLKYQEEPW